MDSGNVQDQSVTNNPSETKALFDKWFEDGLVTTESLIYGTENTACQGKQDGPFPITPLGSVDLSAVEVISDHVENIN